MPYDWTRFSEGDTATAADVNDTFESLRDEVNDLPELSIQRRSLHHAHIPSSVGVSGSKTITTALTHTYENHFISFLDTTYASGPTYGFGWWRVGPLGDPLRVMHDPVDCGDTSAEPVSYVAMANIQMGNISFEPAPAANSIYNTPFYYGVFQFQLQLSSNGFASPTWMNFASTQRYAASETEGGRHHAIRNMVCQKDVPLRALFPASLIRAYTVGGQQARYIHGARVVCSIRAWSGVEMDLHRCNLSIFSLRAPKVN